eukprot:924695-Rhodomonas_salina.3
MSAEPGHRRRPSFAVGELLEAVGELLETVGLLFSKCVATDIFPRYPCEWEGRNGGGRGTSDSH